MKKPKNKAKVTNYCVKIETNKLGNEKVRWIICQHCGKPVYGSVIGDSYEPNEEVVTKWEWKASK